MHPTLTLDRLNVAARDEFAALLDGTFDPDSKLSAVAKIEAVMRQAATEQVLAVRRLIVGPEAEGVFTLFGIVFFLLGIALFGIGLLGEYVGRIAQQVRQRPRYIIGAVLEAHPDLDAPASDARACRTA